MLVAFLGINHREVLFAVEFWKNFIDCTAVVVFSTNVLIEVTRIETQADFLLSTWQIAIELTQSKGLDTG